MIFFPFLLLISFTDGNLNEHNAIYAHYKMYKYKMFYRKIEKLYFKTQK